MKRTQILAILLLAATVLGGCEFNGIHLPFGDKTSPYYWADVFTNHFEDELVVGELEPGPGALEEPRVVLLITGVTIPEEWFGPIVARLERDGFVPVVYEPPELLSGDLFQASEDLAVVVDRVRAESGQDKIDILAECTGGVVARHYIQSLGGDQKVSRLVTFVSPHHGIDKAPLAATIAGWPALYDLSPGSEFLQAVNSVPLPPGVPVTSIYTCSDEYIQPWQGSIVPGARNIGLCDEFVGHFQTFYDPAVYEIMHAALTEPTGDEPEMDGEVEDGEVVDGEGDGEVVDGEVVDGEEDPTDGEGWGDVEDWGGGDDAEEDSTDGPEWDVVVPRSDSVVDDADERWMNGSEPARGELGGCNTTGGSSGGWTGVGLLGLGLGLVLTRRRG